MATLALSAPLSTALFLRVASAETASAIHNRGVSPAISKRRYAAVLHNRAVVLRMVNRSRLAHHLVPLRLDAALSIPARRHSYAMARAGTLFHTAGLTQWMLSRTHATIWGENIAMGPTMGGINQAWMNSAPHRANILNPRYRHAGVGVVRAGGAYWITFDFYG